MCEAVLSEHLPRTAYRVVGDAELSTPSLLDVCDVGVGIEPSMVLSDLVLRGVPAIAIRHPENPFNYPAPFAWIYDVYVEAAQRRHGVASLLTAEAERFARAAGAPAIRLGVLDRNEGARAFYARRGFRDYTRILTKPLSEAG